MGTNCHYRCLFINKNATHLAAFPHAFVVLKAGAQATEDELKQHVRDELAHFKTPQAVSFVEELPKTATGKVQKYVLRQQQPGIAAQ